MAASAPSSSLYRIADTNLNGGLARFLREGRKRGESFQELSRILYAEHDVAVSHETLRAWCDRLGLDTARAS